MEKLKMVFRDFVWPQLPEEITVADTRQAQKLSLQKAGEAVQDLGPAGRTVTGEGLFLGARAVSDWEALWRCFSAGGTGTLLLPGAGPMEALFRKLALSGPPREGRIAYTFTFWEVLPPLRKPRVVSAQAGDSLWRLANRWGVPVDALLKQNPNLPWCNEIAEGERVVLP